MEAISRVHRGDIGRAIYARTWYNSRRESIGYGKPAAVPEWLNWDLWQGPAPKRPYVDNLVHYNWHWHWHWGNGELGNNGVHGLDVARWAMQVTFPLRVTVGGGKYRHDDDQQTPDTMMVTYDFADRRTITWEGLSWSPVGVNDVAFGISVHGTDGAIVIRDGGYTVFDSRGKPADSKTETVHRDRAHFADFLDATRTGRRPRADIETAHQSTLLCHLGNIAYRTGKTLEIDPENGHIRDDQIASEHWSREYNPQFEPKVG